MGRARRLKPGGWLLMEMGAEQRAALTAILEETKIFDDIRFRADYAGLDRVVIAKTKNRTMKYLAPFRGE